MRRQGGLWGVPMVDETGPFSAHWGHHVAGQLLYRRASAGTMRVACQAGTSVVSSEAA